MVNQAQFAVPIAREVWMDFYMKKESRACSSFEKMKFYLQNHRSRVRLCEKFMNQVVVPAAIGGSLGGLLAALLVALDFFPGTSPPAIVATGLLGGAFIGASTVLKDVVEIDESSGEYLEWWLRRIQKGAPPIVQDFIKAEQLEAFICPITGEWIRVPVKAPDERTYESMAINLWLEKKEGEYSAEALAKMSEKEKAEIFSPIRKRYFTREDLVFDHDYHRNLKERIEQAFKQKVVDGDVKEGLLLYAKDVLKVQRQIFGFLAKNLGEQVGKGEITPDYFISKIRETKTVVITYDALAAG